MSLVAGGYRNGTEYMYRYGIEIAHWYKTGAIKRCRVAGFPPELLLVIMIEKVNAVRLPPLSGVGDREANIENKRVVWKIIPGRREARQRYASPHLRVRRGYPPAGLRAPEEKPTPMATRRDATVLRYRP